MASYRDLTGYDIKAYLIASMPSAFNPTPLPVMCRPARGRYVDQGLSGSSESDLSEKGFLRTVITALKIRSLIVICASLSAWAP